MGAKKSKKNRKVGRDSVYCKFYAATHRREKNKLVRLHKHLVNFPDDAAATAKAEELMLMV